MVLDLTTVVTPVGEGQGMHKKALGAGCFSFWK